MSDSEPQKPRLRWLRWAAFGFFALAIVFVILAFLPNASADEPDWLANIPPSSSGVVFEENSWSNPPKPGGVTDFQVVDRTRFVEMSLDEIIAKLNEDLRPEDGWRFTHAKDAASASWNRSDGRSSSTIWILQEGSKIRVTSTYRHNLSWLEKAKRSLRRFFGR